MFIASLFVTSPSFWTNIPTDSFVFTSIVPALVPVAFLSTYIPIFLLLVAVVEDNVIVPVFSAVTLSFPIEADSLVNIIPADSLPEIFMFPLFFNAISVVDLSTSPNIPAEPSAEVVIVPSFVTVLLLPNIPAELFLRAVIAPLLTADILVAAE